MLGLAWLAKFIVKSLSLTMHSTPQGAEHTVTSGMSSLHLSLQPPQADPGPRIFLNSALELEDESNLQGLLGVRLTGLQITLGLIRQ